MRGSFPEGTTSSTTVINEAFDRAWDDPVFVQSGVFHDRAISGSCEALRFLQQDFRFQSSQPYRAAVTAYNAAIRDQGHLVRSREAFVAAYAEYRIRLGI